MKPLDQFVLDKLLPHFKYMLDASAKLCPYETGATRSTGYVAISSTSANTTKIYQVVADASGNVSIDKVADIPPTKNNIVIRINYSNPVKGVGYKFDIAVFLHEDFYNPTKAGTQAKYLEQVTKRYEDILKKSLDSAMMTWFRLQLRSRKYSNAKTH